MTIHENALTIIPQQGFKALGDEIEIILCFTTLGDLLRALQEVDPAMMEVGLEMLELDGCGAPE